MSWSFRKPTFANAPALLEYLQYAPERGECHYAKDGREYETLGQQRGDSERHARHGKDNPAFYSDIVFGLDYQWVEETYDEKCGEAHE
jgi:hypothetical protein